MLNALSDLEQWQGLELISQEQAILKPSAEAVFTYETADDWRCWDSIALELKLPEGAGRAIELTIQVYPLEIGRPEYIACTSASVTVAGQGYRTLEVTFEQFDAMRLTSAFWRFIRKAVISARYVDGEPGEDLVIGQIRLKKKGYIDFSTSMQSKAVEAGEAARYELRITNLSGEAQAVLLGIERYGFESMEVHLEPRSLVLAPGESGSAELTAAVSAVVAPGGYEKLTVYAVPNGDANYKKQLILYTVRKLPHPYIIHTEAGWEEVLRKTETFEWAREELARYVKSAEDWVVPETRGAGAAYAFELQERFRFFETAVAWKLTGRRDFLEKAACFMRRLADPEAGYPATQSPVFHIRSSDDELASFCPVDVKVCGGVLIHEGEFFLSVASGYDLLCDADIWTEEDRRRIEEAFRLFIRKVDWSVTDGDTNNIPSGAMIGALLCSLAIEDMHWVQRFIHGSGGVADMIATGIMDDGWYFEVASNYVILFAEMFTRAVQACLPWGINLRDLYVPASYNRNAMLSPWSMPVPDGKPFLGMSFGKFGPVSRNYRSLKDVWDALLPFIDYRGILVGANDSTDKDMAQLYDLAYYIWRDPRYISVIRDAPSSRRDLIYGIGGLPMADMTSHGLSAYADNAGLCVLRSQTEWRKPAEQIQAVIKYGSHGGYHGHFDRTGLVSLSRYGRNAYGPFASWYGYASFMFKMWVQTSMAHNMVVVDQRMQEPVESNRLLFHSGGMMQACAVETKARWCDPPYGGQTPYPERFPEDRAWIEGREMPVPAETRKQGDIGEYSEPVRQRRLTAVTDDYVVIADSLLAEEEHVFDCLYHFQGYQGLEATTKEWIRHTGQMNKDPFGAGQFITDCDWYECEGTAVVRFSHLYDQERDDADGRHVKYNEDGKMNLDVHAVWPPQKNVMTGWYPEADSVNKRLSYAVRGDGALLAEGRIGAWILGKHEVNVPLTGIRELSLQVQIEAAKKKTVFWGDPYVITKDGGKIHLAELPARYSNVNHGNGIGADYYGGPVHLEGKHYAQAVPFEPEERSLPAEAVFDLTGINAVSFHAVIGGDYPVGNDEARRKTVSFRSAGRAARFITVLEPYEGKPSVLSAEALSENEVMVRLADGRVQRIQIRGLDGNDEGLSVRIEECVNGMVVRAEATEV
ncbi:hypothetical protein AB6A23_21960 [Paenibacillus tarimensis]